MNPNTRVALGLAMIARNPATLIFILPLLSLALLVGLVLLAGWLLLKLAEAIFAKPQIRLQAPLVRLPEQVLLPAPENHEPQKW